MKRAFFLFLAIAVLLGVLCGCDYSPLPSDNSSSGVSESTEPSQSSESSQPTEPKIHITVTLNWPEDAAALDKLLRSDPNTTDRLDEIASVAKRLADSNADEAVRVEKATRFISENYPNYFDTNEKMEYALLCGYYLDYKFEDGSAEPELGTDVTQAIKYVYRGAEKESDDATQENLSQVWKWLDKLDLTEKPTSNDTDTTEPDSVATTEPVTTGETLSQRNALATARSYLSFTEFSYNGLIEQLEYEEFSHDDAVYAADHCGADWNEQALKTAKQYLKVSGFSYSGLIEQLEYEGFTHEEATYGVDNCGADWYEQAAKSARSYLNVFDYSRNELISQLQFEGFTYEQAVYGAEQNGY